MVEAFASASALLLLDQWSKSLVRTHLPGRCWSLGPILRVRLVTNLKSMYRRNGTRVMLVLLWVFALVAAIALARSGTWFQSLGAQLGLGLALGGAAGNLLDVLRRGYIVDFIDLRWWPVFNVADLAIVVGLAAALYGQR